MIYLQAISTHAPVAVPVAAGALEQDVVEVGQGHLEPQRTEGVLHRVLGIALN